MEAKRYDSSDDDPLQSTLDDLDVFDDFEDLMNNAPEGDKDTVHNNQIEALLQRMNAEMADLKRNPDEELDFSDTDSDDLQTNATPTSPVLSTALQNDITNKEPTGTRAGTSPMSAVTDSVQRSAADKRKILFGDNAAVEEVNVASLSNTPVKRSEDKKTDNQHSTPSSSPAKRRTLKGVVNRIILGNRTTNAWTAQSINLLRDSGAERSIKFITNHMAEAYKIAKLVPQMTLHCTKYPSLLSEVAMAGGIEALLSLAEMYTTAESLLGELAGDELAPPRVSAVRSITASIVPNKKTVELDPAAADSPTARRRASWTESAQGASAAASTSQHVVAPKLHPHTIICNAVGTLLVLLARKHPSHFTKKDFSRVVGLQVKKLTQLMEAAVVVVASSVHSSTQVPTKIVGMLSHSSAASVGASQDGRGQSPSPNAPPSSDTTPNSPHESPVHVEDSKHQRPSIVTELNLDAVTRSRNNTIASVHPVPSSTRGLGAGNTADRISVAFAQGGARLSASLVTDAIRKNFVKSDWADNLVYILATWSPHHVLDEGVLSLVAEGLEVIRKRVDYWNSPKRESNGGGSSAPASRRTSLSATAGDESDDTIRTGTTVATTLLNTHATQKLRGSICQWGQGLLLGQATRWVNTASATLLDTDEAEFRETVFGLNVGTSASAANRRPSTSVSNPPSHEVSFISASPSALADATHQPSPLIPILYLVQRALLSETIDNAPSPNGHGSTFGVTFARNNAAVSPVASQRYLGDRSGRQTVSVSAPYIYESLSIIEFLLDADEDTQFAELRASKSAFAPSSAAGSSTPLGTLIYSLLALLHHHIKLFYTEKPLQNTNKIPTAVARATSILDRLLRASLVVHSGFTPALQPHMTAHLVQYSVMTMISKKAPPPYHRPSEGGVGEGALTFLGAMAVASDAAGRQSPLPGGTLAPSLNAASLLNGMEPKTPIEALLQGFQHCQHLWYHTMFLFGKIVSVVLLPTTGSLFPEASRSAFRAAVVHKLRSIGNIAHCTRQLFQPTEDRASRRLVASHLRRSMLKNSSKLSLDNTNATLLIQSVVSMGAASHTLNATGHGPDQSIAQHGMLQDLLMHLSLLAGQWCQLYSETFVRGTKRVESGEVVAICESIKAATALGLELASEAQSVKPLQIPTLQLNATMNTTKGTFEVPMISVSSAYNGTLQSTVQTPMSILPPASAAPPAVELPANQVNALLYKGYNSLLGIIARTSHMLWGALRAMNEIKGGGWDLLAADVRKGDEKGSTTPPATIAITGLLSMGIRQVIDFLAGEDSPANNKSFSIHPTLMTPKERLRAANELTAPLIELCTDLQLIAVSVGTHSYFSEEILKAISGPLWRYALAEATSPPPTSAVRATTIQHPSGTDGVPGLSAFSPLLNRAELKKAGASAFGTSIPAESEEVPDLDTFTLATESSPRSDVREALNTGASAAFVPVSHLVTAMLAAALQLIADPSQPLKANQQQNTSHLAAIMFDLVVSAAVGKENRQTGNTLAQLRSPLSPPQGYIPIAVRSWLSDVLSYALKILVACNPQELAQSDALDNATLILRHLSVKGAPENDPLVPCAPALRLQSFSWEHHLGPLLVFMNKCIANYEPSRRRLSRIHGLGGAIHSQADLPVFLVTLLDLITFRSAYALPPSPASHAFAAYREKVGHPATQSVFVAEDSDTSLLVSGAPSVNDFGQIALSFALLTVPETIQTSLVSGGAVPSLWTLSPEEQQHFQSISNAIKSHPLLVRAKDAASLTPAASTPSVVAAFWALMVEALGKAPTETHASLIEEVALLRERVQKMTAEREIKSEPEKIAIPEITAVPVAEVESLKLVHLSETKRLQQQVDDLTAELNQRETLILESKVYIEKEREERKLLEEELGKLREVQAIATASADSSIAPPLPPPIEPQQQPTQHLLSLRFLADLIDPVLSNTREPTETAQSELDAPPKEDSHRLFLLATEKDEASERTEILMDEASCLLDLHLRFSNQLLSQIVQNLHAARDETMNKDTTLKNVQDQLSSLQTKSAFDVQMIETQLKAISELEGSHGKIAETLKATEEQLRKAEERVAEFEAQKEEVVEEEETNVTQTPVPPQECKAVARLRNKQDEELADLAAELRVAHEELLETKQRLQSLSEGTEGAAAVSAEHNPALDDEICERIITAGHHKDGDGLIQIAHTMISSHRRMTALHNKYRKELAEGAALVASKHERLKFLVREMEGNRRDAYLLPPLEEDYIDLSKRYAKLERTHHKLLVNLADVMPHVPLEATDHTPSKQGTPRKVREPDQLKVTDKDLERYRQMSQTSRLEIKLKALSQRNARLAKELKEKNEERVKEVVEGVEARKQLRHVTLQHENEQHGMSWAHLRMARLEKERSLADKQRDGAAASATLIAKDCDNQLKERDAWVEDYRKVCEARLAALELELVSAKGIIEDQKQSIARYDQLVSKFQQRIEGSGASIALSHRASSARPASARSRTSVSVVREQSPSVPHQPYATSRPISAISRTKGDKETESEEEGVSISPRAQRPSFRVPKPSDKPPTYDPSRDVHLKSFFAWKNIQVRRGQQGFASSAALGTRIGSRDPNNYDIPSTRPSTE